MTCPIPGGFLVAFEGIDGAGKTTQAQMLTRFCVDNQLEYVISKEPTRGQHGTILRESAKNGRLPLNEELDLFIKDRREHVERFIKPALERNQIVILDRYYFSNVAYQGARGANPNVILMANEDFAPEPDLLVILDVPPQLGLARIRERGDEPNAFETEESLAVARQLFNRMEAPYVHWIDARTGPEIVQHNVLTAFQIAAMNKIARSGMSPKGIDRTLEFFGGKPLPMPVHA
jgi:dTMP kinase